MALADSLNRIESRAYVFPVTPDTIKLKSGIAIRIPFVNSGKTPAYKFSMVVKYQCWDTIEHDQDPRLFVYHSGINEKNLAPGQFDPEIVKPDLTHWKKGSRYYLLFGRIRYFDFFGRQHSTTFAYSWEYDRTGFACFPGYDACD